MGGPVKELADAGRDESKALRKKLGKLTSLQQKLEETPAGQGAITALIILILLIGVVCVLPDSDIKRTITPYLWPVTQVSGLDQQWGMYAPNPYSQYETVEVHVIMADGSDRVWTRPNGDALLGSFSWAHWRKWNREVVRTPAIQGGFVHWVIRQLTKPGERATRAYLVLRTEPMPAPGTDRQTAPTEQILYDEDLTAKR